MESEHNKIILAGELLLEASNEYNSAKTDVGFSKSILLAGAVIGIISPWLEEIGIKSSQLQLAEMATSMQGTDLHELDAKNRKKKIGNAIAFYRYVYNSMKHAGKGSELKASDDLVFKADLQQEAYYLIGHAIADYNKLPTSQVIINENISNDLLTLLQSPWVA